jgi:hypothetical protein
MVDTEQKVETNFERLKRQGLVMKRGDRDFVMYAGLLDLVTEQGIQALVVTPEQLPSSENGMVAVMLASLTMADGRVFTEIGDADQGNVGKLIAPHIIRMAATRAKARAMRDCLNIGVTALEELGDDNQDAAATQNTTARPVQVPQAMLNDFEQQSGMQQPTSQRTTYNRAPAAAPQGGQQSGPRQFQKATGPSGRQPSPKQVEHLEKNASFDAPGIPSHDEAMGDGGLASMRLDAIFAQNRRDSGSFR